MNKIYQPRCLYVLLLVVLASAARANIHVFHNTYVPHAGVSTTAQGTIVGTYNDVTNTISYSIVFSGLVAPSTAAHFHGPATATQDAGVVLAHTGFPVGVTSGFYSRTQTLTDAQEADLLAGLWYSNIHSETYRGGEIRAQIIMGDAATTSPFRNTYVPHQGVTTTATGMIIGTYNQQTNTISYSIVFSGLVAPSTAAHFHGPATATQDAGVVLAHTGFPVGVTSGFYSRTQTLTDAQEADLLAGLWYSNIHSETYRGGEIRAQIILTDIVAPTISNVVVDPATLWPPNHKMHNVTVSYTSTDNFPAPVTCSLSVSSDEPVTSESDDTSPDWVVVNSHMVQLRAERMGSGDGRTYTVTVTCTDAQGNWSSRTATVEVAHDRSGKAVTRAIGIEPESQGFQFRVAPNPARGAFHISIQGASRTDNLQLRLYDAAGRLVEYRNHVSGDLEMGRNIRPGTYLLKMIQGSEVRQLRLVKLD